MTPRTKEQNEAIRKERTDQILQAAIHEYAEKGFAASEIGEIAQRAGVARALVYHYFKNKQTLFRELYEYMMDKARQATLSHFEQEGSAPRLFGEYARIVCEQVMEEPAVSRFFMRISLDVHYLYPAETFSPFEWVKDFIQPMALAIEKGMKEQTIRQGDANLMAMQFWGAVSQGMNYLDRLQQDLLSGGVSEPEAKGQLKVALEQVIESAQAVVRPE
ncbi:TetR/AcrR family transcriptional regulator [Paenibacillus beijingensis]|uniref:TetR family transcriptional regulator n=1 Tax=Paenibacillus beijingensis TaxID=1126833 RepID=A0A0D5NP57_9BACL|nr:TetR/AcrR family transcriptional regulator [Paenibacillus beijingensis]AJY76678.1 TetR family transcriptional regulator [Paenibacillus beijingensis]